MRGSLVTCFSRIIHPFPLKTAVLTPSQPTALFLGPARLFKAALRPFKDPVWAAWSQTHGRRTWNDEIGSCALKKRMSERKRAIHLVVIDFKSAQHGFLETRLKLSNVHFCQNRPALPARLHWVTAVGVARKTQRSRGERWQKGEKHWYSRQIIDHCDTSGSSKTLSRTTRLRYWVDLLAQHARLCKCW